MNNHRYQPFHIPAFEKTINDHLLIQEGQIIVDGTCGEGGHAAVILPVISKTGRYIAIDRDKEILDKAKNRLMQFKNQLEFVHSSYAKMDQIFEGLGLISADNILIDLGLSMYHLKNPERGFSFLSEETLDMRFEPAESPVSALDVVQHFSESEISDILYTFGEERMARKIARKIFLRRKEQDLSTCSALAKLIAGVKGTNKGPHPATQSFQALRIYVNAELHQLGLFLEKAHTITKKGSLLAFITYHSIEDRIVKHFALNSPYFALREKKPILPELDEIRSNPSVRSAKLRVLLKIE